MSAHEVSLSTRLRGYVSKRRALLLSLALLHLGLLFASGWLVSIQIEAGPVRVLAIGLLGLMAVVVVVSPGSAAALVFIVGGGLGYLVLSAMESTLGQTERTPYAYEVLALAAALFLVHAVDSLREILPSDAAIESAVLTRWIRRTAEALVPGLVLGGLLVMVPTASTGGVFWLVGAGALLLAAGLPALALRPRPWVDGDHPTGEEATTRAD